MKARLDTTTRVALVLAVALGVAPAVLAQTPKWEEDPAHFQLELRYWVADDLKATTLATGAVSGNTLDLVSTVGIEDEGVPEVRFTLLPSSSTRIRFGYTRIRFDGGNQVDGTFHFNGAQFGNGALVSGELKQDYYYLDWVFQPFEVGEDTVRFGFVLGLHGWSSQIKLYNDAPEVETSKNFDNFFPAAGLALDWNPSRYFTLFAQAAGVSQGADGWHLDAEGGVKISPIQALAIVISYRQLDISNEENDSDSFGRWTIRGVYAGVDIRF
jgi:hypothetical protein